MLILTTRTEAKDGWMVSLPRMKLRLGFSSSRIPPAGEMIFRNWKKEKKERVFTIAMEDVTISTHYFPIQWKLVSNDHLSSKCASIESNVVGKELLKKWCWWLLLAERKHVGQGQVQILFRHWAVIRCCCDSDDGNKELVQIGNDWCLWSSPSFLPWCRRRVDSVVPASHPRLLHSLKK